MGWVRSREVEVGQCLVETVIPTLDWSYIRLSLINSI